MTPEELEDLVIGAKPSKEFVAAFSQLTEQERKKLSTTATQLRDQIYRGKANKSSSPKVKAFIESRKMLWDREFSTAVVAVFAVGPISQTKKRRVFLSTSAINALTDIILDRKPEWLDEWIAYELEQEFSFLDFKTLRTWIKAGICKKPDMDAYTQLFSQHLVPTRRVSKTGERLPTISEKLLAEPDLLDDIWGLFRVETFAFNDNIMLRKGPDRYYGTWTEALLELSENGDLDRRRLLDASLEGLQADVKQNHLSNYWKFHQALEPTKVERTAIQDDYLALLCHPVGHVVRFGLGMVNQLEKDKVLDTRKFLSEVQVVFFLEAKGNAVTALKLIKRILKNNPKHTEQALKSTVEALRHQNADVQALALDILEANKQELNADLTTEISPLAGFVASSLKQRVLGLAGQSSKTLGEATDKPVDPAILEVNLSGVSADQRRALRIDDILVSKTNAYLPIDSNILNHQILPTVDPISPITDLDELIAAILHAVEVVDTPDDVDRILDGISRFCSEKPADFSQKIAPLLGRMKQMVGRTGGDTSTQGMVWGYGGLRGNIYELLRCWLERTDYKPYSKETHVLASVNTLIRSVAEQTLKGHAQSLISLPTHSGGWIDPLVWVERLLAFEKDNSAPNDMDLCLSLLRLAPDNRETALKMAGQLTGPFKRIAQFVFGENVELQKSDNEKYGVWISAARARFPVGDLAAILCPLKLDDKWPGSVQETTYDWHAFHQKVKEYNNKFIKVAKLHVDIDIANNGISHQIPQSEKGKKRFWEFLKPGKKVKALNLGKNTDWHNIPSAALHHKIKYRWYGGGEMGTPWIAQWVFTVWPQNTQPLSIAGVSQIIHRIDENASSWSPSHGYFSHLFQKRRGWHEPEHLLVCVGLVGKDADARGLSIDALIFGIENGLVDIEIFANTLTRLCAGEWVKLNRLGDNLMQVSQISRLHAYAISECIQLWLPRIDYKQRNIFKILEVLLESQSAVRLPLNDFTKQSLQIFKGSSKAAKLARVLLKLSDYDKNANEQIKQFAILSRL